MWITRLTRQIEQLAASSRLIYSLAALYYRQMVQREAELAQIGPEDRVLCIGEASVPTQPSCCRSIRERRLR